MMNLEIEKPILSIDAKNSVCYTEFLDTENPYLRILHSESQASYES